jgi:hypothetical protein
MRLPRMTTRRWMIMIAVVAIVLGAIAIDERRDRFRQLAAYHDRVVQALRPPYVPQVNPRRVAYHRDLAAKYERAARYPWLPLEPEPSELRWRRRR